MLAFEWDPDKAAENAHRHGLHFTDVQEVFADPHAIRIEDRDHAEQRWVILGFDALGRLVVVCYTWRDESRIRLISARKATRKEGKHAERRSALEGQ